MMHIQINTIVSCISFNHESVHNHNTHTTVILSFGILLPDVCLEYYELSPLVEVYQFHWFGGINLWTKQWDSCLRLLWYVVIIITVCIRVCVRTYMYERQCEIEKDKEKERRRKRQNESINERVYVLSSLHNIPYHPKSLEALGFRVTEHIHPRCQCDGSMQWAVEISYDVERKAQSFQKKSCVNNISRLQLQLHGIVYKRKAPYTLRKLLYVHFYYIFNKDSFKNSLDKTWFQRPICYKSDYKRHICFSCINSPFHKWLDIKHSITNWKLLKRYDSCYFNDAWSIIDPTQTHICIVCEVTPISWYYQAIRQYKVYICGKKDRPCLNRSSHSLAGQSFVHNGMTALIMLYQLELYRLHSST